MFSLKDYTLYTLFELYTNTNKKNALFIILDTGLLNLLSELSCTTYEQHVNNFREKKTLNNIPKPLHRLMYIYMETALRLAGRKNLSRQNPDGEIFNQDLYDLAKNTRYVYMYMY